jgi:cell shape-determining protein MreD
MAGDVMTLAESSAGGDEARESALQAAHRKFWRDLAGATATWGRGILVCGVGAAVMQGVLSAFPALLCWGVPVTVPVSALLIALVGLRCAPQWGVVFAAFAGLLADAAGPALLGETAWAYLPVAACFTLLHRRLRRDHAVTLLLYAAAQTLVQTTGTYLGLRWAGLTSTAGHVAGATIVLSVVLTTGAAGALALGLRGAAALHRHFRREA